MIPLKLPTEYDMRLGTILYGIGLLFFLYGYREYYIEQFKLKEIASWISEKI